MRAEIKRLHSPDVPDLRRFQPEQPDDFSVLIQVLAGPSGLEGEESFDIVVVTPKRLSAWIAEKGPLSGRHMLIVNGYDYDAISRWLLGVVAASEGDNWGAIAERIARFAQWEFEDYTEADALPCVPT